MRPQRSSPRRNNPARRTARRFTLPEMLEARMLMSASTYTVTSSADSGAGTLRDAISQVNQGLVNEILFDTSAAGMNGNLITLNSALPTIMSPVQILATTSPTQAPAVQIAGPAT